MAHKRKNDILDVLPTIILGRFPMTAEHLEEFCGIKLSDNTICDLCQKEAVPMGRWERKVQSVECRIKTLPHSPLTPGEVIETNRCHKAVPARQQLDHPLHHRSTEINGKRTGIRQPELPEIFTTPRARDGKISPLDILSV